MYHFITLSQLTIGMFCVCVCLWLGFALAFRLLSESEWLKRFALVLHDVPFKNYYVPNSTFQGGTNSLPSGGVKLTSCN